MAHSQDAMTNRRGSLALRLGRNLDRLRGTSRPATRASTGRPGTRRADPVELHAVLTELARSREQLEDLRSVDGPLMERVLLASRLHDLRAEAARLRRT